MCAASLIKNPKSLLAGAMWWSLSFYNPKLIPARAYAYFPCYLESLLPLQFKMKTTSSPNPPHHHGIPPPPPPLSPNTTQHNTTLSILSVMLLCMAERKPLVYVDLFWWVHYNFIAYISFDKMHNYIIYARDICSILGIRSSTLCARGPNIGLGVR